jgi:hypothetical protein
LLARISEQLVNALFHRPLPDHIISGVVATIMWPQQARESRDLSGFVGQLGNFSQVAAGWNCPAAMGRPSRREHFRSLLGPEFLSSPGIKPPSVSQELPIAGGLRRTVPTTPAPPRSLFIPSTRLRYVGPGVCPAPCFGGGRVGAALPTSSGSRAGHSRSLIIFPPFQILTF